MATILSEAKSTGKDPYAYYTVNATASDRTVSTVKVKVDVTSRLSSSQAFLGKGSTMGLIGYIKLNEEEHSITLKTTNQSWSGTTEHTASATFTVEDLEGSQSQLTDIKFRVSRTGSAADNYSQGAAMSSKNCSNLQIGVGHTEPTNVTYVMTEKNQKLINAGISNDLIVENLSIKEFLFSYTLHDGASFKRCRIWNMASAVYGSDENPFSINLKNQPFPGKYEGKILLLGDVVDSLDGYGASPKTYYDYIPYTNISLVETSTTARRNGQTSGKVYLNINGTFYNGSVGNITQTKPTIKYKYWKLGDTEPTTYDNTIPSDNISILNNTFSVSNFEIGSSVETATNYFNPELAYRVKIYVEDNFTSYTSQDKSIPIGEATWTEYKDRVDFKNISIRGTNINNDNGKLVTIPTTLFENANGTQSTITLSASNTNYKSIEIIFKNNDNSYQSTGRLYNANGHTIYLISINVNSSGKSWLKATEVTLNGNKITFSNHYSEITLANGSSVSISHTNTNYITKVIGYDN